MTDPTIPGGDVNPESAVALLRTELSILMAHTAISGEDLRIEAVVRAQQALDDTKAMADLRDKNIATDALATYRAGLRKRVAGIRGSSLQDAYLLGAEDMRAAVLALLSDPSPEPETP